MSPVHPVAVSDSAAASRDAGDAGRPIARQDDALDADLVARWLVRHPAFFDTHADVLADLRLSHGVKGKAVSLIERQVAVLRDKNQALEARLDELIRFGQENDALNARLQRLNRELLRTADPAQLPAVLEAGLRQIFSVPQVAIRLWPLDGVPMPEGPAMAPVSAEIRRTADAMRLPYCGPSVFAEAAGWLADDVTDAVDAVAAINATGAHDAPNETASVALFALRVGARPEAFGLVVMGSPDAGRFQAGMGTAFLEQLAELASASLSRLQAG